MDNILEVKNLSVKYPDFTLKEVSFQVKKGEILSIIGESGSGKTTIAKAITCLIDKEASVSGQVIIHGQEILSMEEKQRKALRMRTFSMVFQNSSQWLNPSLTLESQLKEILVKEHGKDFTINHDKKFISKGKKKAIRNYGKSYLKKYGKDNLKKQDENPSTRTLIELMEMVGLKKEDLKRYPHELSGGMSQKFMVACAIALNPELVIMDEPTSSLDVKSTASLVELIRRLNKDLGISFLIITHDLKVARDLSERILVLYGGHMVESGQVSEVLDSPRHPYTKGLLNSSLGMNPMKDLWGIRVTDESPRKNGCAFYGRCTQRIKICGERTPKLEEKENHRFIACNRGGITKIMEGKAIKKSYGNQEVLKGIDITLYSGEILSIIGKSAAGKSTLGKILGGFIPLEEKGEIIFNGKDSFKEFNHSIIGGIQMVFQDSERALNPYMTVEEVMKEPLKLCKDKEALEEIALDLREKEYLDLGKKEYLNLGEKGQLDLGKKQPLKSAKSHERTNTSENFQDNSIAMNDKETLKKNEFNEVLDKRIKEHLRDVGLPLDNTFLKKKIKNLSGGQKQRINIARALVMKPSIIIADEPTSMLDPSSKANILRMLKGLQNKRGFTMIMISHDLESVLKISDRIYILKGGKLKLLIPKEYVEINMEAMFHEIG